jgi:ABC-type phosphate transport system substrate-binding protein
MAMSVLKRLFLVLVANLAFASIAMADVVVVVDARSELASLTQNEVINIFLGRHRKFPTGEAAVPVDQPATSGLRAEFYRKLVDKEIAEINAYWARLYFSGKTNPPVQVAANGDVISQVIGRPGGIGYIERAKLDNRVRVVLSWAN